MSFRVNKNLVWREIEDKVYIVDSENEKMHSLNFTASFIWKMILKGKNKDEIIQKMKEEFIIEGQDIEKDIEEIILKFLKEGLIYEKKEI